MSKKIFVVIVILMSISLIGIVSVQYFWVQNAIKTAEKQFSNDVEYALSKTADNIYKRELNEAYIQFMKMIDSVQPTEAQLESGAIKTLMYEWYNPEAKTTVRYSSGLLEENYKVPSDFFDRDSLMLKRIFSSEEREELREISNVGDLNDLSSKSKSEKRFIRSTEAEKAWLEQSLQEAFDSIPISRRTDENEINANLDEELLKRGIDTDFKFAVYRDNFPTAVKSGYFRLDKSKSYFVPLFKDQYGEDLYQLYVTFPKKNQFILKAIGRILMLSIFFIIIIIIVFTSSLYQMLKQKKISEIKTDFINNMTHEFKTPIATINLATDAIRNPKIIDDKEKVLRYVKMINDENVRMHSQVENVLRISKLEKNQIDMSMEELDFQDVIEDAISHIQLLLVDRGGILNTHFEAIQTEIQGNEFHLTNMCVNVLENAIKYSPESPRIDVYTRNDGNKLVLQVKDQGMGMSKAVQKNIFDKFYREHGGNIHNVKGHGLGLNYVKQIVTRHQGSISVESEKGKGSIFTIKLDLI